jgi:hypothetical protein
MSLAPEFIVFHATPSMLNEFVMHVWIIVHGFEQHTSCICSESIKGGSNLIEHAKNY